MFGIIYKSTCLINNKIYIGQTLRTLDQRIRSHLTLAFSKKNQKLFLFQRSLKKYLPHNFKWEIIDSAESQSELNKKEIYWINFYDSTNKEKGYNLKLGGLGGVPTESTKKKMSDAWKIRKSRKSYNREQEEMKLKLKVSNKSPAKNQWKEKREAMKKSMRNKDYIDKKVECIETGEVFDDVYAAEEQFKSGHILSVLKGKRKSAGGFHWKFK